MTARRTRLSAASCSAPGRISPAQQRALDALAPRYGIAYRAASLDSRRVFGRDAPVVLEIGFGMGETTAAIAAAHPRIDFIAIEVHDPGVGSLLARIDAAALRNLRDRAPRRGRRRDEMIAPRALAGVHVYFPDPWPKKRHHKRRLLKPAFVHALALRLAPGGYLHVATDWEDYAEEILDACAHEPLLANTAQGFAPGPRGARRPSSRRAGWRSATRVCDILFTRAAD